MKTTDDRCGVGAVMVLYHAETASILPQVQALSAETAEVCIVDNSETPLSPPLPDIPNVHYIALCSNTGIAHAQNVGIEYLAGQGYDYILFSDQDSLAPKGLVKELVLTIQELETEGIITGGVCPRAYNKQSGTPYPHQCNSLGEMCTGNGRNLTEVTFCMSSMSLLRASLFSAVGPYEDPLFIDGVDSEWCWRAYHTCGARFFVNEDLHMQHMLGMGTAMVAGKERSLTPPYRIRYQYRNYLRLICRRYVPLRWKLYQGAKYLAKAIYYGVFSNERMAYLKAIVKGCGEVFKDSDINKKNI